MNKMEQKQTAVEWLVSQLKTSKYYYKLIEELNNKGTVAQPTILEQAKIMEKQQIMDAVNFGDERGNVITYSTAE